MKVSHVITGLRPEGAQAMLAKLVLATRGAGVAHAIISLMDEGALGPALAAEGVRVSTLGMRAGVPAPGALLGLVRLLRRERPDVVQSWMYHADLLAGLAAPALGIPLVWGIHHSDVEPGHVKPLTRVTRAVCARLSGVLPDRIVCAGEAARRSHAAIGYRRDRLVVIENGFDGARFRPDAAARARIRTELAIAPDAPVVGLVARFHPDKDHATFVGAAREVAGRVEGATFVLAGDGASAENAELRRWIAAAGLTARVRLLGRRADVPAVLAAVDVLASSSRAEAFPQVLGEAMLCGVPCAVTDCGDAREIVGTTGRVAPPRDPAALGAAIAELVSLPPPARAVLGEAARARILARYELRAVAARYQAVWAAVVEERARRAARAPAPRGERP